MSAQRRFMRGLGVCALLASACGGDEGGAADASAQDAALLDAQVEDAADAAGMSAEATGTFLIELIEAVPASGSTAAAPASTSIFGRVYDAPPTSAKQWRLVDEEGDCQLLEPYNPFCDPACERGFSCTGEGTCRAMPVSLHLGEASLEGLRDTEGAALELVLSATAPANIYQPRDDDALGYPPVDPGGVVTLRAYGGALAPFELSAKGIAPVEVLSSAPLVFGGDEPTEVRWAPQDAGDARIIVRVDISHHGGQKGELVCDVEDSGELVLPSALVDGLIALGVAGNPSLDVQRVSRSAPLPALPGIALELSSSITVELEIPGVISCINPGEQDVCPEGQICQPTRVCR